MRLVTAASVGPEAARTLDAVHAQLRARNVPGELLLVGGSSVPEALTKGDIDLHLRVPTGEFAAVVAMLRDLFVVVHPDIWGPTLATFTVTDIPPVGLAVTPAGSEHDLRFTRTWRLLAADPGLVREYNRVKLSSADSDYESAKSKFFDHVLELWAIHPAGGVAGTRGSGDTRQAEPNNERHA
jgi:hypothetical protein